MEYKQEKIFITNCQSIIENKQITHDLTAGDLLIVYDT